MSRFLASIAEDNSPPESRDTDNAPGKPLTRQELVIRSATLRSEAVDLQARAADLCARAEAELERARRVHDLRRNGREPGVVEEGGEPERPR